MIHRLTPFASLLLSILLCILSATYASGQEPMRIGAIFSISGWGARGGQSDLDGAILAAEDLNAAGRKVDLIVEDCRSDLAATAAAFRKLKDTAGVSGIVGPNWAEFLDIVAPLAEDAHMPIISSSGFEPGLFEGKKFLFTLWPPHTAATQPLSDFIKRNNLTPLAVLIADNAYYEGVLEAMKAQLQGSGVDMSEVQRFTSTETDFRSVIGKLKNSSTRGILVLLVENYGLSAFLKQARQMHLSLPLLSANAPTFDETLKEEPELAKGLVYYDFIVPGGREFAERFRKRFGRDPGFGSARAYDALYLMKEASEQCGHEPERVAKCLSSARREGITGKIEFDNGVIRMSQPISYIIQR